MKASAKGAAWWGILLIVGVIIAQSAIAAIPGSGDKVFFGCYSDKSGALRLIDKEAGEACKKTETEVFWNQTGPRGQQGLPGADGAPGTDGASAYDIWLAAGNTGTEQDFLDSLVGDQGEQGPAGSSVAARLRWTGSIASGQPPVVVSLGPWTQSADALNEIVPGTITFSLSAGGGGCTFGASLDVRVPGWGEPEPPYFPREVVHYNLPSYEIDAGEPDVTKTVPILLHALNNTGAQPYPIVVFEPGVDTTRSLEVTVTPSHTPCGQVTAMSFDVVEVR